MFPVVHRRIGFAHVPRPRNSIYDGICNIYSNLYQAGCPNVSSICERRSSRVRRGLCTLGGAGRRCGVDALGPLLCRVWCEASEVSMPHRRRPCPWGRGVRTGHRPQRGNRTRSALVVSTMHKRVSHMYTTELQSYRYPPPNSHGHSHARHTPHSQPHRHTRPAGTQAWQPTCSTIASHAHRVSQAHHAACATCTTQTAHFTVNGRC